MSTLPRESQPMSIKMTMPTAMAILPQGRVCRASGVGSRTSTEETGTSGLGAAGGGTWGGVMGGMGSIKLSQNENLKSQNFGSCLFVIASDFWGARQSG